MTPKYKLLFTTDPSGEHNLSHVTNTGDCTEPPFNHPSAILALRNSQDAEITFTGEELTSLAEQWLKSARYHPPFAGRDMVLLTMPQETWDLLYETLSMDAESKAFDPGLRTDISNALSLIHELNPPETTMLHYAHADRNGVTIQDDHGRRRIHFIKLTQAQNRVAYQRSQSTFCQGERQSQSNSFHNPVLPARFKA